MSEQYSHDPQANDDDFRRVIEEQLGGELPALIEFDEQRQSLYDHIASLVVELRESPPAHSTIEIDTGKYGEALKNLSSCIITESSSTDEAFGTIISLMYSDNKERTDLMRSLLDDTHSISEITHETLKTIMNDLVEQSETTDELTTQLAEVFCYDLINDINAFFQHIGQTLTVDQADAVQSIEIKRTAKDHVVDVAKIAAGVSIALAIDRLLRRR